MIPTHKQLERGLRFLARRHGANDPNGPDLRVALKLAATLARGQEPEEPAALLCAVAILHRGFPEVWREMALGLAKNHAARIGYALRIEDEDEPGLFAPITTGNASYEDIRAWVAERLAQPSP